MDGDTKLLLISPTIKMPKIITKQTCDKNEVDVKRQRNYSNSKNHISH